MNAQPFERRDWVCGAITGILSGIVYILTAAPNVTLLDSGEFIVAAQQFGVPHPTGYPLWTLLAWLFQLLPLGNVAWELAVFSGVCAAAAVAVCTALGRAGTRWIFAANPIATPRIHDVISISCGLLFAFSFSQWSQATIVEVYALHALLTGLILCSLFLWLHQPRRLFWLVATFFLLALTFSNHHLAIALAPLPFLAILIARGSIFWDTLMSALLTALLVYLGFALLSQDHAVLKTAVRFFYFMALAFIVFIIWRRGRIQWTLIAFVPTAVIIGLLPYAYMPFASATNPPMNWGYTRDPAGFYFSINRSQYSGTLSDQSLRTLGRLLGSKPAETADAPPAPNSAKDTLKTAREWTGHFWIQLVRSFTPLSVLAYFAAFLVVFRIDSPRRRTWVYLLHIGFILAAFLQPIADKATIDFGGWWLQMPYHTYTNLIFALICCLGFPALLSAVATRFPRAIHAAYALLVLPIVPLWLNLDECSQHGRDFGWMFGHDMLKDLPPGAVVYGGTDPGRFVPTYMIFGESFLPETFRHDPSFDRKDLYIITQNALGEPFYMSYIGDHYGAGRPKAESAFEKWLGRHTTYPEKPLILPTEAEMAEAIKNLPEDFPDKDGTYAMQAIVAHWVWERNKADHRFFVEESFPMKWTYDYAVPHGITYEIRPEKVESLSKEVVDADMAFWDDYVQKLLNHPRFRGDYDAKRAFSKLRNTMGNIYEHRKMPAEAERAFRQALAIWPGNIESAQTLAVMLWDQYRFNEVIELFKTAVFEDPNHEPLWDLLGLAMKREKIQQEVDALLETYRKQPRSRETVRKLIDAYLIVGETNNATPIVKKALKDFDNDPEFLREAIAFLVTTDQPKESLAPALRLVAIEEQNSENHFLLARAHAAHDDKPAAQAAIERAIALGGLTMREQILADPGLHPVIDDTFRAKIAPQLP